MFAAGDCKVDIEDQKKQNFLVMSKKNIVFESFHCKWITFHIQGKYPTNK